ncbi:hypothetical protein X975_00573, partial [Stegodyphus mimosarum]
GRSDLELFERSIRFSFPTRGSISIMQANSDSEREFFKRIVSYIRLVKSFENP